MASAYKRGKERVKRHKLDMQKTKLSVIALIIASGLALLPLASNAVPAWKPGSYRWTDDHGVVHYSDQVPPEEAKHPRAKLDPQAKVTEYFEGLRTPEQIEQSKRLRKLRVDQQRILTEQRDSDTSLNRTYRSEDEMQVALQGKLNTIESAKKIADANRLHQEEILRSLIKRAADSEDVGQPVPQLLRDSIESTRKQIAIYQDKSRALENSKAGINAAFAKDLKRFRRLQELSRNPEFGSLEWQPQRPSVDILVVSAYTCAPAQCDTAWALAKEYLKSKTTRPLVTETPTIMQTAGPRTEKDLAILLVRIAGKQGDVLFLDTSCHLSSLGEELCTGEAARNIRAGFVPYMEEHMKSDTR
jgi:hypothetical protein